MQYLWSYQGLIALAAASVAFVCFGWRLWLAGGLWLGTSLMWIEMAHLNYGMHNPPAIEFMPASEHPPTISCFQGMTLLPGQNCTIELYFDPKHDRTPT